MGSEMCIRDSVKRGSKKLGELRWLMQRFKDEADKLGIWAAVNDRYTAEHVSNIYRRTFDLVVKDAEGGKNRGHGMNSWQHVVGCIQAVERKRAKAAKAAKEAKAAQEREQRQQ